MIPGSKEIARVIAAALGNGRKLLLAGNGGSAADAQHSAGEMALRCDLCLPAPSDLRHSFSRSILRPDT